MTFLFSYLCSEIKTKPKNHGLRQCCKTSPPSPYYIVTDKLVIWSRLTYHFIIAKNDILIYFENLGEDFKATDFYLINESYFL